MGAGVLTDGNGADASCPRVLSHGYSSGVAAATTLGVSACTGVLTDGDGGGAFCMRVLSTRVHFRMCSRWEVLEGCRRL